MTRPAMATKVKITWDDILARRAAQDGVADGLEGAAAIILEASNQLVPYASGALMGSGAVDFDLEAETAHVYYDTPYAKKQHEDRRLHIKGGRRGRYLATAAMQGRSRVADEFGEKLKFHFSRRAKKTP